MNWNEALVVAVDPGDDRVDPNLGARDAGRGEDECSCGWYPTEHVFEHRGEVTQTKQFVRDEWCHRPGACLARHMEFSRGQVPGHGRAGQPEKTPLSRQTPNGSTWNKRPTTVVSVTDTDDPGTRTSVVFTNLGEVCARFIKGADAVVGCTAWLSNDTVLDALEDVNSVSVIVNDDASLDGAHNALRRRYAQLAVGDEVTFQLRRPYSGVLIDHETLISPVAVVGSRRSATRNHPSLMHHKFLVRVEKRPGCACFDRHCEVSGRYVPTAVWTGSFNPTRNGDRNLENAVIIESERVAARFVAEWHWTLRLSRGLPR